MKKIEAIIKPFKIDSVKEELSELGIDEMTIVEAREFSRQGGRMEIFRGTEYKQDFVPKVKLELVVPDEMSAPAIGVICHAARTGQDGDGKVFVSTIDESLPIDAEETPSKPMGGRPRLARR